MRLCPRYLQGNSPFPLERYVRFPHPAFRSCLQVGENPDNPNGQRLTEAAECTYSNPEAPAADVAAHAAAALALSSNVVANFVEVAAGGETAESMLASAEALFEYSKTKAPLEGVLSTNATDAGQTNFGVRCQLMLY
jgi:hypothetical protein